MQVKRGPGRPRRKTLEEMKAELAQKNKKTSEEVGLGEGRKPKTNDLRELKRLYRIKMAGS